MEERYEIRGKLGQGGLGAVYRAWDRALKREVAIKRIVSGDEGSQQEEATRQLEKETGALAALQHPHIVTIFDVGSDEDGPFVVMELITGQTLEDAAAKAPLTWSDFRELVLQIQEALVAAQDLGLVHRDLKPSNVMLNWLPSGKFQAKIVDFGLAKFSPKPSLQTTDQTDSVFGSIFYMAPEQFERTVLDSRADMYSIGCVYYYALTGRSPFEGDTGPQVMAAHLEHRVIPLAQVRPDIPRWAADWVMWHINRQPAERPENARETLRSFIQLDVPSTQSVAPQTDFIQPAAPKRPRLLIPGAPPPPPEPEPAAVTPVTAPQPLAPPDGAPPSLHTTSLQAAVSDPQASPSAPPPAESYAPKPKLVTSAATLPASAPVSPAVVPTAAVVPQVRATQAPPTQGAPKVQVTGKAVGGRKKGLGNGAKGAIAAVLGISVLLLAWFFIGLQKRSKINARYNEMVAVAANLSEKELPVDRRDLGILLDSVRSAGSNVNRETVYRALFIARATDGTDVDQEIFALATSGQVHRDIRNDLITRIIGPRKNEAMADKLIEYAKTANDDSASRAALEAVVAIGGDDQFDDLVGIIRSSPSAEIRKAAEQSASRVLLKTSRRAAAEAELAEAYAQAPNEEIRHAFLRLLGLVGGSRAKAIVTEVLEKGGDLDKLGAALALGQWPDDSMFGTMMEFLGKTSAGQVRTRTFEQALRFLVENEGSEANWRLLAGNAKTSAEQRQMIQSLAARRHEPWAIDIVEGFGQASDDDDIIDLSEKAVRRMQERAKVSGGGGEE